MITPEQLSHKNLLNQSLELLSEIEYENFEIIKTFKNAEGEDVYLGLALIGLICAEQTESLLHDLQSIEKENKKQTLKMLLKMSTLITQISKIIHKKNKEFVFGL